VALGYLVATVANAAEVLGGLPPTVIGVVASGLYLAAWLLFATVAGWRRGSADLRRTSVLWAVLVAGSALCGPLLRQGIGGAAPGTEAGVALVVAAAAPLYGLAGLLATDTAAALVGVTVTAAALTMVLALLARGQRRRRLVRRAREAECRRGPERAAG
jgi:hypothetical protein